MNASDRLVQLLVIRQLLLQRLIAGEERKLTKLFDDIAKELRRTIQTGNELTTYQGRKLDKQIEALAKIANVSVPKLGDLPELEAEYLKAGLEALGLTEAALPARSTLAAIADASLVQGATIGDWFSRLTSTLRFDIERAVKVGVSLGQTNKQIADNIIGVGDKGPQPIAKARRDAMAITRTAVQTVANDARMSFYGANPDYIKALQWVSTLDSRTSDICIARSGKTWSFPSMEPIGHSIPWNGGPPAHWSCFPADTLISSGGAISNASKRWFDGDLIVIRTAAGNEVSCTPNHPILTNRGWLAAHLINEGDQVATGALAEREAVREWDDQNVIPSIHDVTEAFFRSGKMLPVPMPTTAKDFHGDGVNGEVAIVGANGLLPGVTDPSYIKAISERIFIDGCPARSVSLVCRSHLASFFNGCDTATAGGICGGCQLLTTGEVGAFHPGILLLAAIAKIDPAFAQDAFDNLDWYLELFKDAMNTNSAIVEGDDFIRANGRIAKSQFLGGFGFAADINASLAGGAMQDAEADAKLLGDLLQGKHGLVSFADVIHVGKRNFSGHVYNLETEHGYYTANGIVVHNCRSTVIPVLKTLREMGIDRDNFQQTTRASMDGQVAADITFDQFLRGKPQEFADKMLGKGRAELWREGKITLSELLNQRGQPLTLKELAAKYGKPELD